MEMFADFDLIIEKLKQCATSWEKDMLSIWVWREKQGRRSRRRRRLLEEGSCDPSFSHDSIPTAQPYTNVLLLFTWCKRRAILLFFNWVKGEASDK